MTYKQIEQSREIRLWIGQIIVPAIGVAAVVSANPNVRRVARQKANAIKRFVKDRFKKKENGNIIYLKERG